MKIKIISSFHSFISATSSRTGNKSALQQAKNVLNMILSNCRTSMVLPPHSPSHIVSFFLSFSTHRSFILFHFYIIIIIIFLLCTLVLFIFIYLFIYLFFVLSICRYTFVAMSQFCLRRVILFGCRTRHR